jgi:flavin reductase (DIM6/NTAB) family NADH-FMN oxidoreductase RutF/DNA-binding IclR family transcriptional regulator
MTISDTSTASDPRFFRSVLGNFPTGVVAVTSMDAQGHPTGMAVGSFTSVSLDPPLVAFLPDKSSSTFPKIRENGKFCVNVLGAHQQSVCRSMSIKGGDKFADVLWSPAPSGMPRIHDSVAWIDCEITAIHDAGDHWIVVGSVTDLDFDRADQPLVFFQGGYGRFASTSLTAPAEADLYRPLSVMDTARTEMVAVANELGVECCASAVIRDQLVLVGSCIPHSLQRPPRIRLGQRMPFVAPLALPWAAWADEHEVDRWIGGIGDRFDRTELDAAMNRVRSRGWSLVLHSSEQARLERAVSALNVHSATAETASEVTAAAHALNLNGYEPEELSESQTYDVRVMSATVFDENGRPALLLSLYQAPRGLTGDVALRMLHRLTAAASRVTDLIGGQPPE